jgi:protein TonB
LPEPVPQPKPKPKPAPSPKPKPKPKPKKKSTWKAVDPKEIKLGRRVAPAAPAAPALTADEIRKSLSSVLASSSAASVPNRFGSYYAKVMQLFYARWNPPATATSASGSAVVRISIAPDGRVLKRAKIKGSGDALYDKTVMDAVGRVRQLPRPPADYPYDYVEVVFTLDR